MKVPVTVYMPVEVRDQLAAAAAADGRELSPYLLRLILRAHERLERARARRNTQ